MPQVTASDSKANGKLALCVNPMSGRDVRRLAARAANMTHEAKRDIVARVVAGADAVGIADIYVAREPFSIAQGALEHMPLDANLHIVDIPITYTAKDAAAAMHLFKEAGCHTVVSLGGDGTNRALVQADSAIDLVPISTGTNNVFPALMEPTLGGMVAGLNALGKTIGMPESLRPRAKALHLKTPSHTDIGLIDVVLLRRDHVGNMLPFDSDRLEAMLLTRAEPNSVGMSPIGGFIDPVYARDDCGLWVQMGSGSRIVRAPLSPGHFRDVAVSHTRRIEFGEVVTFSGPGVIALDGDRDHTLREGEMAYVTVRRDGPRILDVEGIMRWAVGAGMMASAVTVDT